MMYRKYEDDWFRKKEKYFDRENYKEALSCFTEAAEYHNHASSQFSWDQCVKMTKVHKTIIIKLYFDIQELSIMEIKVLTYCRIHILLWKTRRKKRL